VIQKRRRILFKGGMDNSSKKIALKKARTELELFNVPPRGRERELITTRCWLV